MREPTWNILADGAGLLLSACPRGRRFAVAQRLARTLQPIVRRTALYARRPSRLDGYQEEALRIAFRSMCRLDVEFDPHLSVHNADAIGAGGAVIVSGHFFLNSLLVRWLFDRGHSVTSVMFDPPHRPTIVGTRVPLDVIRPDRMVLVRIRRRVAAGGVVVMALDSARPLEGGRTVDTPAGPRYVSDTLPRFAERARVPILYGATRVAPTGEVVANVVRPSSSRADEVLDGFCRFLLAETEQIVL